MRPQFGSQMAESRLHILHCIAQNLPIPLAVKQEELGQPRPWRLKLHWRFVCENQYAGNPVFYSTGKGALIDLSSKYDIFRFRLSREAKEPVLFKNGKT